MAFNVAGFSQGLSQGLMTGARFGSMVKADRRADEEFGWKKEDQDRAKAYSQEVEDLAKNSPIGNLLSQNKQPTAPAAPAAGGLTPPATEQAPAPGAPPVAAGSAAPAAPAPEATGLTPAAPAQPPQPQMPGFNDMMDYLIKRAAIDVKYGKMDGQGMMALYNGVKAMNTENATQAIKLFHAGRTDEALQAFNSSGTTKAQLVNVQDGEYDLGGGNNIPTRIITLRNPQNGQTQTINTAQALIQFKDIADISKLALEGGKLSETKRHNKATEESDMIRANADKTNAENKDVPAKGGLTQKDGLAVLKERYGGKFEGGVWFPDEKNKDVGLRAMQIYEQKVSTKIPPVEAAKQAAEQAEREQATGKLPIGQAPESPGASGTGTKDYSNLWK